MSIPEDVNTREDDDGMRVADSSQGLETQGIQCSIRVAGVDFSLVPVTRAGARTTSADALRTTSATTRRLWDARRAAGLTQAQLAKRLGRSQTTVSQAESGQGRVGERYVRRVLEACGLKAEWGLPERNDGSADRNLDPRDVAGLDPETCKLVRRGSERDLELGRKYAWWDNFRESEN